MPGLSVCHAVFFFLWLSIFERIKQSALLESIDTQELRAFAPNVRLLIADMAFISPLP